MTIYKDFATATLDGSDNVETGTFAAAPFATTFGVAVGNDWAASTTPIV